MFELRLQLKLVFCAMGLFLPHTETNSAQQARRRESKRPDTEHFSQRIKLFAAIVVRASLRCRLSQRATRHGSQSGCLQCQDQLDRLMLNFTHIYNINIVAFNNL